MDIIQYMLLKIRQTLIKISIMNLVLNQHHESIFKNPQHELSPTVYRSPVVLF